jgi:phosphatidate cytidylyltransferase
LSLAVARVSLEAGWSRWRIGVRLALGAKPSQVGRMIFADGMRLTLLGIVSGATGAYFAGRAFGRHKLAPKVSPGKTWEGVYGALAAVAVYALALVPLAGAAGHSGAVSPVAVGLWVACALALVALSVEGDLFESLLKRHAEVKDSGRPLPGHGGVLDRIDALLAAMPAAALLAHAYLR